MAKSESGFLSTVFTLFLGIFFVYSAIKMPLKESSHRKISGVISHVEHRGESGRRKTPHRAFRLKREKIYLKDRLFSNLHIVGKNSKGRKINDLIIEGKRVSFHIERGESSEYLTYIHSLEVDGKTIVPLKKKWKLKIQYLFLGLLSLGVFFLFAMDD